MPAAFLPGNPVPCGNSVRRPRCAKCTCLPRPRPLLPSRTSKPRTFCMQGSSPSESNATPDFDANIEPSQVDITSTNGFALQDAVEFRFADLSATESRFQRGGAYAIRDVEGEVLYMGYSKNIATKLQLHERLMPEKCVSFQVYVPPVPPELISPEMLENVLEYWVRENGDIPRGNTVDRALWESENSVDRKDPSFSNQKKPADEASRVPIRERVTPRRVAHRRESSQYDSGDPFTDTFRSSGGRRRKRDSIGDWSAAEEDYVEVDVDPLDPFSAANRNGSSRSSWDSSSWDSPDSEQDNDNDEWFPLVAIMGIAGLVWVLGLLGNALPAATPSLGM